MLRCFGKSAGRGHEGLARWPQADPAQRASVQGRGTRTANLQGWRQLTTGCQGGSGAVRRRRAAGAGAEAIGPLRERTAAHHRRRPLRPHESRQGNQRWLAHCASRSFLPSCAAGGPRLDSAHRFPFAIGGHMRAVFSLGALLLVVYLVSQMAGIQLQALKSPAGGGASGSGAAGGAAVSPADAAADKVRKAMEQGRAAAEAAVQRADDAASR